MRGLWSWWLLRKVSSWDGQGHRDHCPTPWSTGNAFVRRGPNAVRRVGGGYRARTRIAWAPILGLAALTVVACANSPSDPPGKAPTCHTKIPSPNGSHPVPQTGCAIPTGGVYWIPLGGHVDCSALPSPAPATS